MPNSRANGSQRAKFCGFETQTPQGHGHTRITRAVMTITATALLIAVGGCGIRLETATPKELDLTPNESARQAMVNDLQLLSMDLMTALESEPSKKTTKSLNSIAKDATARETALGGVYESGLPEADGDDPDVAQPTTETQDPEPNGSTTDSTEAAPSDPVQATISRLLDSSARVRASLDIPEDTGLARVLASVAIGQVLEARSLAKVSALDATYPESLLAQEWTADAPKLDDDTLLALIASEDYAGYAFEVAAAMGESDVRQSKLSIARVHRAEAAALAKFAGVTDTANDPRRSAYKLPLELDADKYIATADELSAMLQNIETSLAEDYFVLIDTVEPTERALVFDKALARSITAKDLGAKLNTTFPLVQSPEGVTAS